MRCSAATPRSRWMTSTRRSRWPRAGPRAALSRCVQCGRAGNVLPLRSPDTQPADVALSTVFREEAGRLTSSLTRLLGDFDVAEDIVQDTLLGALERWRRDGIPARPGAWLATAAKRHAIDRLRREARYRQKLALLEAQPGPSLPEPDDRLSLIFTCCHPSLAPEAQVPLTLRAVCGLTT